MDLKIYHLQHITTKKYFYEVQMQNFQNIMFNSDLMGLNELWQKNYETIVKANQINAENQQAIFKRLGEIVQKQITEAVEATHEILTSQSPEQCLNKQNHFMQASTKNIMSDSKEVAEMFSKANMEVYDIFVKRTKDNIVQTSKKTAKV
ncbi:MAG: phasin family protein [Rickettsiaceae bacterium]|nr:phasin family protein [Rickettsiaceae bacterium]